MLEVHDSYEKTNGGLLRSEISLYCHIDASIEDMVFRLLWWRKHPKKNVGFLVQ
jgi:hypothetical protein